MELMLAVVIEEVAVTTDVVTVPPSKKPEPATDNLLLGVLEPTPTLPPKKRAE